MVHSLDLEQTVMVSSLSSLSHLPGSVTLQNKRMLTQRDADVADEATSQGDKCVFHKVRIHHPEGRSLGEVCGASVTPD